MKFEGDLVKKLTVILALLAVTAVVAQPATATPRAQSAATVSVKDNLFSPSSLSVKRGATVTWKWKGKNSHNVVVASGPKKFQSSIKKSGSFSKKLTKKGTYSIICTLHVRQGMKMKLRVG